MMGQEVGPATRTRSGIGHAQLIQSLSQQIESVLGPLLPRDERYALVGFPYHSNVGDSAIWLGERKLLRRLGLSVVYTCDRSTYSRDHLAARLKDGTILLHGGGALVDPWFANLQIMWTRVIRDFPGNRIVQLPQTIHLEDRENRTLARTIINGHPDLTLLARDRRSLEFARTEFNAPSLLCPDTAFFLGPIERPGRAVHDIEWLARTDCESATGSGPAALTDGRRRDWLAESWTRDLWTPRTYAAFEAVRFATGTIRRRPLRTVTGPVSFRYDRLAAGRVARGFRALSRGRVVVTDRLHGHILSLLLGIPHVFLDNTYGKNRSFYGSWTAECSIARWADETAEALNLARALASELGHRGALS
jgi:exopolysaccharide biosynthesis predicted pyruvyltransferase EpsI